MIRLTAQKSSTLSRRNYTQMKKIMTLMLGMSLVLGAASVAFAQATGTSTTTSKSTKKSTKGTTKKSKTSTTTKTS